MDAARVRTLFEYAPSTGILIWRFRPSSDFKNDGSFKAWNTKYAGTAAGSARPLGYVGVTVDRRRYSLHRLVWLYVNGVWPASELDHINGNPNDSRIENLRECTHAENHQNRGVARNNKSGFTGISWYKRLRKWRAEIKVNGKQRSLGLFQSEDEAKSAYLAAKQAIHAFQPTPRLS